MIFGFSGSGKSTLAVKLGKVLGIEPTHMDRLHWLPGWVESTREYKRDKLAPVLARGQWIIEGNYRGVLWNERLESADTVILTDVNRFTCFKNALSRSIKYRHRTRPDMGEGCTEKFDFEFAKWILFDGRKNRRKYLDTIEHCRRSGKNTYIFKNKRQINKWLKSLD